MTASTFSLGSAGAFFFFGLVFGAWKYACIARSDEAQAPVSVDVAHRAALLYAFACMLVSQLCRTSAWSDRVNLAAAVVLVACFAVAVLGYAVHGALRDTDNQLRRPHRLGPKTIGNRVMLAFMVSVIVAAIGRIGHPAVQGVRNPPGRRPTAGRHGPVDGAISASTYYYCA